MVVWLDELLKIFLVMNVYKWVMESYFCNFIVFFIVVLVEVLYYFVNELEDVFIEVIYELVKNFF